MSTALAVNDAADRRQDSARVAPPEGTGRGDRDVLMVVKAISAVSRSVGQLTEGIVCLTIFPVRRAYWPRNQRAAPPAAIPRDSQRGITKELARLAALRRAPGQILD